MCVSFISNIQGHDLTHSQCAWDGMCGWEVVRDSACGLATAGKSVSKSTLSPSVVAARLGGTLFACKIG